MSQLSRDASRFPCAHPVPAASQLVTVCVKSLGWEQCDVPANVCAPVPLAHSSKASPTQIQYLKAQLGFNLWFFTLLRLASCRNQGASQAPHAVFSHLV